MSMDYLWTAGGHLVKYKEIYNMYNVQGSIRERFDDGVPCSDHPMYENLQGCVGCTITFDTNDTAYAEATNCPRRNGVIEGEVNSLPKCRADFVGVDSATSKVVCTNTIQPMSSVISSITNSVNSQVQFTPAPVVQVTPAVVTTTSSSSSSSQTPYVRIYEHCNYRGNFVVLKPGKYNLKDLEEKGMTNDSVSSIQVQSGLTAVLYEHENFNGKSWTFTDNVSCFTSYHKDLNDKVSSIKIF